MTGEGKVATLGCRKSKSDEFNGIDDVAAEGYLSRGKSGEIWMDIYRSKPYRIPENS